MVDGSRAGRGPSSGGPNKATKAAKEIADSAAKFSTWSSERRDATPESADRRDGEAPSERSRKSGESAGGRIRTGKSSPRLRGKSPAVNKPSGTGNSSPDQHSGGSRTDTKRRANRVVSQFTKQVLGGIKFKGETRPLTAKEIEELKPEYVETILDWAEALDQIIQFTTADENAPSPVIWSTISSQEAEAIADYMLKRARKSKRMAGVVKGMMTTRKHAVVLMIMGTRIKMTGDHYHEHGFALPGARKRKGQSARRQVPRN